MGYTMDLVGGPQKAFNAHKQWMSGWFDDFKLSVIPQDGPVRQRLVAFVDYSKIQNGDGVVLMQIGQTIFLQYNRAKDYNIDTISSAKDRVTVVEAASDTDISNYLAGLKSGEYYSIKNFESSSASLVIKVCDMGEEGDVDYATVEISLQIGAIRSQCSTIWGGMENSEISKALGFPTLGASGITSKQPSSVLNLSKSFSSNTFTLPSKFYFKSSSTLGSFKPLTTAAAEEMPTSTTTGGDNSASSSSANTVMALNPNIPILEIFKPPLENYTSTNATGFISNNGN
jgi:hypothetical protein